MHAKRRCLLLKPQPVSDGSGAFETPLRLFHRGTATLFIVATCWYVHLPDISRTANRTSSRGMYLNGSYVNPRGDGEQKRGILDHVHRVVSNKKKHDQMSNTIGDRRRWVNIVSRANIKQTPFFRTTAQIVNQAAECAWAWKSRKIELRKVCQQKIRNTGLCQSSMSTLIYAPACSNPHVRAYATRGKGSMH